MKKIFLTLFSILVFGLFANGVFADFSDVSESHYAYKAISYLQESGVVQGYEDGTFKPDREVNRAEFLKMLYETIGMQEEDVAINFPDVPGDAWYTKYVKRAFYDKVAVGYPDGTFRPENSINFVEAVKVVMNGFFEVDELYIDGSAFNPCENDYSDDAEIDTAAWYWKYLYVAENLCISSFESSAHKIAGLNPSASISRADMAEMLYRAKLSSDNNDVKYSQNLVIEIEETEADEEDNEDTVVDDEKPLTITTAAFKNNQNIPLAYTCYADDFGASPTLKIVNVPETAKSLALIMEDPDAVRVVGYTWYHVVLWNLPVTIKELVFSDIPEEAIVATNSEGGTFYAPPCPPQGSGVHNYKYRLFSLDKVLDLADTTTAAELEEAMAGHILEEAQLVGLYEKK